MWVKSNSVWTGEEWRNIKEKREKDSVLAEEHTESTRHQRTEDMVMGSPEKCSVAVKNHGVRQRNIKDSPQNLSHGSTSLLVRNGIYASSTSHSVQPHSPQIKNGSRGGKNKVVFNSSSVPIFISFQHSSLFDPLL